MGAPKRIKPTVSFEFFPPRTQQQLPAVIKAASALAVHKPAYQTVTFGAGGSTTDGTLEAVRCLKAANGVPTASHLTAVALTRSELNAYTDTLIESGVNHIVALRGDLPEGLSRADFEGADYFPDTPSFIEALKARHPFEISVGAYPEKHPEAQDQAQDVAHLKRKCDAGADRAITQFFFDNADFYRFRDACAKAGISTPLVPGILPIVRFKGAFSFAKRCGARVPVSIRKAYERVAGDVAAETALATELACMQVEDLAANGVNDIHIYTLNRCEMADITARAFLHAKGQRTPAPIDQTKINTKLKRRSVASLIGC